MQRIFHRFSSSKRSDPFFTREPRSKKKMIVMILVMLAAVGLLVFGVLQLFGCSMRTLSTTKLPCLATQDVMPFGDNVLYYNGTELVCLSKGGSEKWRYTLGRNASYHTDGENVVAWTGTKLVILNEKGSASYDTQLSSPIQFARVGSSYVSLVTGEDVSPVLYFKDLKGATLDHEESFYKDKIVLDMGFLSGGDYLWVTSMDLYGKEPDIYMNVLAPAQKNLGEVNLGSAIVYKVIYAATRLNVISTRQLRAFDYNCKQEDSATQLLYGWQLIASDQSAGRLEMLYALSKQTTSMQLTDLRYLSGRTDKRYTLPNVCYGACVFDGKVYAFSDTTLYRADISTNRFSALDLTLSSTETVTGYLGMLNDGVALLSTSANNVYAVTLP